MAKKPISQPYTLSQITDAVMAVLTAISGGHVNQDDAKSIASMMEPSLNSPTSGIAPGASLPVSAEFIRLMAAKQGATSAGQDQQLARKQALDALNRANVTSAEFAAALGKAGLGSAALWAGRIQQVADASANNGKGGTTTGTARPDYQTLALATPRSLHDLTKGNFAQSAFARVGGLDFSTVDYLRRYDRNFTGQDVLSAANDVKRLGFDPKNQRATRNQATIRHYDDKPDETTDALEKFGHLSAEEKKVLTALNKAIADAKTPEARAEALKAKEAFHAKRSHDTGVDRRIEATPHPKAKEAITDQKETVKGLLDDGTKPAASLTVERKHERKDRIIQAPATRPTESTTSPQVPGDKQGALAKLRGGANPGPSPGR